MSWYIAGAYIGGWVIVLSIFRWWYQKQKKKIDDLPPWFDTNESSKAYFELLQSDPENTKELQMALMKRGMTTIARLWALNEEKTTLTRLTQSGAVSDDAWIRLKKAEKSLQVEVYDIEAEAETLKKGWGKLIMENCTQLVMLQRQKEAANKQKVYAEEWESQKKDPHDFEEIDSGSGAAGAGATGVAASASSNSNSSSEQAALSEKEREKIRRQLIADEERSRKNSSSNKKEK